MGTKSSKPQESVVVRPLGDINLTNTRNIVPTYNYPHRPPQRPLETIKYQTKQSLQPPTETRIQPSVSQTTYPGAHTAWKIWNTHYREKIAKDDLAHFGNRLQDNADKAWKEKEEKLRQAQLEKEEKIRQIQFKRARVETEILTQKESPKPALSIGSLLDLKFKYRNINLVDKKIFFKPERPELTPEMLMLVDNASIPNPATEVLVQIDGVDIARKDIRTLIGLNWLNDEIINAYMYLIVARSRQPKRKKVYSFNTFFYPKVRESGYNSVKRWTRKVDIFSYDFLLVPIHLGNHWCLAFVNFNNRHIEYYDSLGGSQNGCCDTLLEYLRYESNDKKKQDFDDENWQLIDAYREKVIPQQENCSDCGVFACTYAEYLTRGAKLSFKQEHMKYFRKKMIYELMTKEILD